MRETKPPQHDLLDFQGEAQFSTSVKYFIEPRGYGLYGLVCLPKFKPSPSQLAVLKQVYNAFENLNVSVSENGAIVIEFPAGERIGWVLNRLAIFYRLSLVKEASKSG